MRGKNLSHCKISEINIKQMHKINLDMAKFFDDFCKRNNLTYFLCGGCCIGAIRHNGFIPWDDDVDVFMPRKDYERLKKIWTDNERYEIQINEYDHRTFNTAISIHDINTTFIKTNFKNKNVSHGLAMDIFPIDACPNGLNRKRQKIWAIVYSLMAINNPPLNHGILIKLIGKLALALVIGDKLKYKLMKYAEKQMSKYRVNDCDKITELCAGPYYMQKEYPKQAFEKQLYVDFEDTKLPVPIGYDSYLKIAFGNYMELPPIEKRMNHHEYEFIDLEKSYKEYERIVD